VDPDHPFKNHNGPARVFAAWRHSRDGLRSAVRGEASFRQELAACALLVPLALWAPVSPLERLLMIGALALVLIVELLNSAIEATVDRVGIERHPLSKRAKDLGSAAVMLALVLTAATWLTVLWPIAAAWVD
jgi:diacylglycerol kinase (ATP)